VDPGSAEDWSRPAATLIGDGPAADHPDVRFGSKADIAASRTALKGPLTRPVPFSFWIDRTSSGAFVRRRSLLETCQPT
jgi:hypothetical protein